MKKITQYFFFLLLISSFTKIESQTISVFVNGVENGATLTQGDTIKWEIILPNGGETFNEIILDINNNQLVDSTDKFLFSFSQIDGSFGIGENNLPDMDGTINGKIVTKFKQGLAPISYIFSVKHKNAVDFSSFKILPLQNPAAKITGQLILPPTMPPMLPVKLSHRLVEASLIDTDFVGNNFPLFWQGLTDSSGKFVINLDNYSTMRNPWMVEMPFRNFDGWTAHPQDTIIWISQNGNYVVNFYLQQGTIVTGNVTDFSTRLPIKNATVFADKLGDNFGDHFETQTNEFGNYHFTLKPGKYFIGFKAPSYIMQFWYLKPNYNLSDTLFVGIGDTLKNINGYLTKGIDITGRVTANYVGINANIFAVDTTTKKIISQTFSSSNGDYALTVTPGIYYVGFHSENFPNMFWKQKFENEYPYNPVIVKQNDQTITGIDNNFTNKPNIGFLKIIGIKDVPNDQGKQVFCVWYSDRFQNINEIEKFSVWRRDAVVWTFVGSAPARDDSVYSLVVPTLFDSVRNFIPYTKFQVTAHFKMGGFFTSPIDSGFSIDNLIPSTPGGFNGVVADNKFYFKWRASTDEDFKYFAIYRSLNKDFRPSQLSLYKTTIDTFFVDENIQKDVNYYYYLTAYDFNENESKPTGQLKANTSLGILGVNDNVEPIPEKYFLSQNYPNPFNNETIINFQLPKKEFVSLKIYDLLGKEILTLVDENKNPGVYNIKFSTNNLSAGIYIYKLSAGNFTDVKKMQLIK